MRAGFSSAAPQGTSDSSRRGFLRRLTLGTVGVATGPLILRAGESPNALIRAGVMGLSRGMAHVDALLSLPNVEVAWVCDVDQARTESALQRVRGRQSAAVRATNDVRRIIEDREVQVLSIAAPNHWHAPATILACAAGQHVYVEKPGSHNLHEAEWMVAAAKRYRRRVQLGTQRRSWPAIREMIERLHGGVIGPVRFARSWYNNARTSIGRGRSVPVPAGLNYDLWQGPAPERPYVDNLVHYNWHWRWHWGGGELANNGVHALDLIGWGLQVNHPIGVSYSGGRYHYNDDQETPDTGVAVFDFGQCGASWDCSSCIARTQENLPFVAFYGDGGSVTSDGSGYQIFDVQGKALENHTGPGGDGVHFANFLQVIRDGGKLNADIGEGQKAARLCHLGNIAYRTGHTLRVDPLNGKIRQDLAADFLGGRSYREGWTPKV